MHRTIEEIQTELQLRNPDMPEDFMEWAMFLWAETPSYTIDEVCYNTEFALAERDYHIECNLGWWDWSKYPLFDPLVEAMKLCGSPQNEIDAVEETRAAESNRWYAQIRRRRIAERNGNIHFAGIAANGGWSPHIFRTEEDYETVSLS